MSQKLFIGTNFCSVKSRKKGFENTLKSFPFFQLK